MALKYPVDCKTPAQRTEYLYAMQEKLRLLHNVFVKWKEGSLTQTQYDKLPGKIRVKYPYKEKFSEAEMLNFIKNDWRPMNAKVSDQICIQRRELFKSEQWNTDPNELID